MEGKTKKQNERRGLFNSADIWRGLCYRRDIYGYSEEARGVASYCASDSSWNCATGCKIFAPSEAVDSLPFSAREAFADWCRAEIKHLRTIAAFAPRFVRPEYAPETGLSVLNWPREYTRAENKGR